MTHTVYFVLDKQLYRCSRRNLVRLLRDKAAGVDVSKSIFGKYKCDPVGAQQVIDIDGWDSRSLQRIADDEERKLNWKQTASV